MDTTPEPFEVKAGISIGSIKVLKFFYDRAADRPDAFFNGADAVRRTGLATGLLYPILKRLTDDELLESKWTETTETIKRRYHVYRITAAGIGVCAQAIAGFNDEMAYYRQDKIQKAAPEMLELLRQIIAHLERRELVQKEDWYKITPELALEIRKIVGRLTKVTKLENIP